MRAFGVVLALVILAAAAPAAHATGHSHFPSSIDTTVAAGGTSTITSPTLDPGQASAMVDILPAGVPDEVLFAGMRAVLAVQPTKGRRLMTCVGIYLSTFDFEEGAAIDPADLVDPHPLQVLLLAACLAIIADLDSAGKAQSLAAATAAGCGMVRPSVPATFTKAGGKQYTMSYGGPATIFKGKSKLKVACKRKGSGLRLKLRPRKKGATLKSVVGPKLMVGLYNPLDAAGPVSAKLTFRR